MPAAVKGHAIKPTIMKPISLQNLFGHPFAQLICFLIIPIEGQIFVAPYGWYIRYAVVDGQWFAFAGIIGILLVLASLFFKRHYTQPSGLICMWVSLIIFYVQSSPEAKRITFQNPLTCIVVLAFVAISLIVILKSLRWKSS
jgi:hypothetical protein